MLTDIMEKESMKVCILGATFDTANMGVSMLAAGAIQCVARRFPQARIFLLDYARQGYDFDFPFDGKHISMRLLNIRFSKRFYLANNIALLILLTAAYRLVPLESVRRLLLSNKYLKEILESDLFVSLAYGDSFSDIYGMGRLLYIALPQLLVLVAGKRLVLLPQTIGPFKGRSAQVIARNILKRAEIIYSRDKAGLKTTQNLLALGQPEGKLRFCYDLAFDVDPVPPKTLEIVGLPAIRKDRSVLVGINVSGLLFSGGYTQDNMFTLKVSYEQLVHKLIELLVEGKSANVLLIPHVFAPADDLESDSRSCDLVFESMRTRYEGRVGVVRGNHSYTEIKHVIGQCEFFLGARMHACIAAISQNIPTVPIAYSDKFAGIMQAIGFENLVVDPRRMSEQEMLEVVSRIYEERTTVRQELEKRTPLVRETIRKLLWDVDGVVRTSDSLSIAKGRNDGSTTRKEFESWQPTHPASVVLQAKVDGSTCV